MIYKFKRRSILFRSTKLVRGNPKSIGTRIIRKPALSLTRIASLRKPSARLSMSNLRYKHSTKLSETNRLRPTRLPELTKLTKKEPIRISIRGRNGIRRGMRSWISESKINERNKLGGPEGVSATGPPLYTGPDELAWPPEIKDAYAISMRPQRFAGLQARLGKWSKHVKKWNATNGYSINVAKWINERKAVVGCNLNRGVLGCHDSHYRLWQHIVQHNIPMTLCSEDDVNIRYTQATAATLRKTLDDAKKLPVKWHILYLGRQRPEDHKKYTASLSRPRGCCGLFAYIVTLEGAKLLVKHCGPPYRLPVDVLVGNVCDSGAINAVALNPRMTWVCDVRSDTRNIV